MCTYFDWWIRLKCTFLLSLLSLSLHKTLSSLTLREIDYDVINCGTASKWIRWQTLNALLCKACVKCSIIIKYAFFVLFFSVCCNKRILPTQSHYTHALLLYFVYGIFSMDWVWLKMSCQTHHAIPSSLISITCRYVTSINNWHCKCITVVHGKRVKCTQRSIQYLGCVVIITVFFVVLLCSLSRDEKR